MSVALLGCAAEGHDRRPLPAPVEVGVVALQLESVALETELPGRIAAFETSEVRPQVSGVIRARLFKEGQVVRRGQTLYRIDDRLYRAAVEQARANLASAKAINRAAQVKVQRYAQLAKEGLVSELDHAQARADAAQAAAAVRQSKAALDSATTYLKLTKVPAPIGGWIGRSFATAGALATAGQTNALATIQRLDPIFVDMQQSSAELMALRRSIAEGGGSVSTDVRLRLEDGSEYTRMGRLEFAEVVVEPSTGSVTLRARFDNPDGVLLPGMYVRASVVQPKRRMLLAPQAGVTRDRGGRASALVIGNDDTVERRGIEVSRTVEESWLVAKGLSPGERLVVEGTERVKPGQQVKPVAAWAADQPKNTATGKLDSPRAL